ncbi:chalcone-flavanone isomerase-domain-containing protein [Stachybotrys elegans]|uniref:Chalcone-flavanone isomerase-domain-containing protein n=1 Tax=Stachybotrys elegans TaxID=80388 RepID=A0A8K0SPL4_9HYPO|nr:chalcone-flavanone isomerase-domain-containing protein [Stachybotrys elegans]
MLQPRSLRPALRTCARCHTQATRRTIFSQRRSSRLSHEYDLNKLNDRHREYQQNRTAFLAAGAIAGFIGIIYTSWKLKQAIDLDREKEKRTVKCDTPIPTQTFKTEAGEKRKVVVHDEEGRQLVPTGNKVVPALPRTVVMDVPASATSQPGVGNAPLATALRDEQGTEFTLVGLGTRTVTFLGFEVYVMGFYVATQDIAQLQKYLVSKINPMATTLIPSEKDALRKALRDAAEGEETWNAILNDAGCRSLLHITPVRDTDFHHLRNGFVRAIAARSQHNPNFSDEAFGAAMQTFKQMFNRGKVQKNKDLFLLRDGQGKLSVLFDDGKGAKELLGTVAEPRVSTLLWLNYLAGSKVASEGARQNIIEGVMEFVERPIGTVATQVI